MQRVESKHAVVQIDGQTLQKLSNHPIIPQEIADNDGIVVKSVDNIDDYEIDRSGLPDSIREVIETHYP